MPKAKETQAQTNREEALALAIKSKKNCDSLGFCRGK